MPRLGDLRPLTVVLAVVVLLMIVCLVARNVVSTNHVLVLCACASPAAGLLALPALATAAVTRRWLLLGLIVVVGGALLAPAVRTLAHRPAGAGDRAGLMVLTVNLRLGKADTGQLVAAVRGHRVDVLAVQELTPTALTGLRSAGLESLLPHELVDPRWGANGIGLFSRFPLADTRYYQGFSNGVISARISPAGLPETTIFSSHLGAPWPQNGSRWLTESRELAGVLAETPGALIDAGDFNATTSLRPLRELINGARLDDASTSAGAATIRTYPANSAVPPLLGIDHVLLREYRAVWARAVSVAGTDHRGLLVRLVR